jgi:hypothetical protein
MNIGTITSLAQVGCVVAIGEYSHGDANIWKLRLDVLRELTKNNNSTKIQIFLEDVDEYVRNIMFDPEILIKPSYEYRNTYPLQRYTSYRIYDSVEYLEFIKFVRENKIKVYGADNCVDNRDRFMAEFILRSMDKTCVNLYFAHNYHICQQVSDNYLPYKVTGDYLREALGDKYITIISAAYKGQVRYDGICGINMDDDIIWKTPQPREWNINCNDIIKPGLYTGFYGAVYVTGWAWEPPNKIMLKPDIFIVFDTAIPLTNLV